jgi:hypothetical protein
LWFVRFLFVFIFLCSEDYSQRKKHFLERHNIALIRVPMEGKKQRTVSQNIIEPEFTQKALTYITDLRNHRISIHCNKRKYRTETVIECL